jgi:hypothetical protein
MANTVNIERIDPLAQTFYVDKTRGMYLTKVGLFFSSKTSSTLPVSIQIRPAFEGTPSSYKIVPGSIVFKYPADVNVDATGTNLEANETVFEFTAPVFLEGEREYAIVVKTNAAPGDYKVWTAKLGSFPIGTTQRRISQQPATGIFFRSSNANTFTPDQETDLCFKLYKAVFNNAQVEAVMNNAIPPYKRLRRNTTALSFAEGSNKITLLHPNHGFQVNDYVNILPDSGGYDSATVVNGIQYGSIYGSRMVESADGVYLSFRADSAADSNFSVGAPNLIATQQYEIDLVQPNISFISPTHTAVSVYGKFTTTKSLAGTETAYGTSNIVPLTNMENNRFTNPHVVASQWSEDNNLSGNPSTLIYAVLKTPDYDVAPVIDLQRASLICVSNMIDWQDSAATTGRNKPITFVDETSPAGGSHLAKWISKPVTLFQSATGIKVMFDCHRPELTDFDLYYRVRVAGDETNIRTISWVKASNNQYTTNKDRMPYETQPNVFREFFFNIGGNYINRSFDDQAVTFQPFDTYQIKIVMKSQKSTKIPRFKNMRIVAFIDE